MKHSWPLWLASTVLFTACELDSIADRIDIDVGGDAQLVRIDLDPTSVAEGVDNTVVVDVYFEPEENSVALSPDTVVFSQYRIDYRIEDEEAPFIAGEIDLELAETQTGQLTLRAVAAPQLEWVSDRHPGGELDVQARISLGGIYAEDQEALVVTQEFTATFADYE